MLTVSQHVVEDKLDFTGQVRAFRSVQVRALASGVILERPFIERSDVRSGQVLYREPRSTRSNSRIRSG